MLIAHNSRVVEVPEPNLRHLPQRSIARARRLYVEGAQAALAAIEESRGARLEADLMREYALGAVLSDSGVSTPANEANPG
jgi:hypothetical protein